MAIIKRKVQEYQPRVIQPLVNIREEEKEIILEAEMAGLTKDDISLDLKGNELTLKGKSGRGDGTIPKGYTVVHKERCPLEYIRTFIIGEEIDKNRIDAQYENGILKVRLAKSEAAQPKKVEIKE
ncbi:MAG: Hsp20/alpha crystallin family protein [Candidatus Omnitrophota bacterium]|nr:MAG: Hsp20/alpha crystallin family protein [Candidatus Omnitrophota bacterium]